MRSADQLRKIINLLADSGQGHVARHILAEEAVARKMLVSELMDWVADQKIGKKPSSKDDDDDDDDDGNDKFERAPVRLDLLDNGDYGLRTFIKASTEKAWLVEMPKGLPIWLPKSRCEFVATDKSKRACIRIPAWLGREKGFEA
jgi:hypothetical protein